MQSVVTLFFQSTLAPRTQACAYAGKTGLDVRTSNEQVEHVFNPLAPQILYNLVIYPELNDMAYGFSWNPWHWLLKLLNWFWLWQSNIYGTNCVSHQLFSRINWAGDEDVAQCLNAIRTCLREYPTREVVLFGRGRGAATILIALPHLNEEECARLKLVILEAPFDNVEATVKTWREPVTDLIFYLLARYAKYERNQPTPLQAVQKESFPLAVPLAFITSKGDKVVPPSQTNNLLKVLTERKHSALHHLELEYSDHYSMSVGHKKDSERYVEFIHDLYSNKK